MKTLLERLEDKVLVGDDCWEWTGALTVGYGTFGGPEGKTLLAHRAVYELLVGLIPEGHQVHHSCGVRHCVRPDHLVAITHADHVREHRTGYRKSDRCAHGHLWTDENTYVYADNRRACRTCLNERAREKRRR